MDNWISAVSNSSVVPLASGAVDALPKIVSYSDPLLSQILAAKKVANKSLIELLIAACDGDLVTLESVLRSNPQLVNKLHPDENKGITALIYAICFNNYDIAEALLSGHDADPDLHDTILNYTPLMWAVYLNQLNMVKLLLNYQADPYLDPKEDGKNAISLVIPSNVQMYEYFSLHNLLKKGGEGNDSEIGNDSYYNSSSFGGQDEDLDDLTNKLKLQRLGAYSEVQVQEDEVNVEDDEYTLSKDPVIPLLDEFDYEKLLPEQFLKFTDSDIPSLLEYIFNLRSSKIQFQHDTKIPAAIIFQLVRYSHFKVDSNELTEFLFECFTARLRSVTNTKSGVFNMAIQENNNGNTNGSVTAASAAGGAGDIVLLSYWLSVIQFLHFYFAKSEIYTKFPKFLQEIINIVQSLIATLSFSINSRLNILIDDCLLDFTNLVDVSNVLYAKDWNLFKKSKKHPNTYDDIFDMLYPPNQNELMKPSPIRYVQVLGALDYVLKIHNVINLFKVQTFSQVFYYTNSIIFNRIISQSRYCTRSKAIQIRLNISAIEDWLRSHDLQINKPENIGGLNKLVHDTSVQLANLAFETPVNNADDDEEDGKKKSDETNHSKKNPHNLEFFYNPLYYIGKTQLQPAIELLQYLQCLSSLVDEESLIMTINQFDCLNYYQLYKVVNKLYKYEVDEPKMPKKIVYLIKSLLNEQGEAQISRSYLHYMTQSTFLSKEVYVYLNPNYIFGVALPNLTELINIFGSGIGGVRILRSKKYQPSLPVTILDDVEEIFQENKSNNYNDTYDYEKGEQEDEEEEDDDDYEHDGNLALQQPIKSTYDNGNKKINDFKGDELFKQVLPPNTLAHKNWGDDDNGENYEDNPW
ncbi:myosin class V heavy chain [Scheffersomyces coipomensis]|uniref:myosin class V heavy chain n=1 Tax=Scheffersomyces coipomensis TaxID=1788519 RepID=UPI00315DBF3F